MNNAWEDELNAFHIALADGKLSEVRLIYSLGIQEYYAFLLANKDRVDKIKQDIEKAKNNSNS